jgi:cytochrome c oxidase subunit 2
VAPIFVLIFIAFPSIYLLYLLEEFSFPSVSVKVIGHQWYWEYQYFDLGSSFSFDSYMLQDSNSFHNLDVDSRLVVPGHVDILFLVTSADVLHSWTVPTLGIKVDAIPGRLNYLSTCSLRSGVFYGQCREICGANHRFMPIVIEFTSIEYFLSYISNLFN